MSDLKSGCADQTEQLVIDDYRILAMLMELRYMGIPPLALSKFWSISRRDTYSIYRFDISDSPEYTHTRYLIENEFIKGIDARKEGIFFTENAGITEKGLKHLADFEEELPHSVIFHSAR